MLRSFVIKGRDGEAPDRGLLHDVNGPELSQPFKTPQFARPRRAKKRSGKVYAETGFTQLLDKDDEKENDKTYEPPKKSAANDDDDDDEPKKKGRFDNYVPPKAPRKWAVFKPADPSATLSQSFRTPQFYVNGQIVTKPMTNAVLGARRVAAPIPRPLFDPMSQNAIVLYDPTIEEPEEEAPQEEQKSPEDPNSIHKSLAQLLGIEVPDKKKEVKVPVVIDPRLGKILRPHQVQGVKFLYDCVTGKKHPDAYGCIMADEMGLGKTLQCITLMWTLLKQSPKPGKSTIDKAIVVCPSSLVRNWANELVKWLGPGAVNSMPIDGKMTAEELDMNVRQWCATRGRAVTMPVVIVSYEKLRSLVDVLGDTPVGLLLADEGHRLKNSNNQTYTALTSINCKRRVILTGTPIQNDLAEYFSLLNFCNPTLLGTQQEFHRTYELPILKGRDGDATDKEKEVGDARLSELSERVQKFIIRRTNDILSKYLPIKYEHVVFCGLSDFQRRLYEFFTKSPEVKALIRGKDSQPLKAITLLRKMCNHPDLLNIAEELPGAEDTFPEGYEPRSRRRQLDPSLSGKMAVLDRFLRQMVETTTDKIVLISNFTQTLDLFEKFCRDNKYGCLRLDGTMNTVKRQKLVDRFNDPEGRERVFLLSSKAGGCGINLIGANRLILFDPDWNPASDMQALARVWRDGQKKTCFVYRFVATGTVEEKIFQRQSHKQSLSSCVVDEKQDVERHYTGDNLRQLFQFKENPCETHDLFKCKRCRDGIQYTRPSVMLYGDTSSWNHYMNRQLNNLHDDLLRSEANYDAVTACFQYVSA